MQKILILDFGSQYTQLIARRIRELNVYCEIHPYNHFPEIDSSIKGVILSGSPASVHDHHAPDVDLSIFANRTPVLGICYGAQLMSTKYGGKVVKSAVREYGRALLSSKLESDLFAHFKDEVSQVWMSHGDTIATLPSHATLLASTDHVENAAFALRDFNFYGIQFHPEVTHSQKGKQLLYNFVLGICNCQANWTPESFVETTINNIKRQVADEQVVMGLSGGVDSTVAAMLIHEAIGKNLHCIFIDNGLLRKNEYEQVLSSYENMGLNIKGVNAKDRFYEGLKGITEPEAKRKIIGRIFIEVFDEESKNIGNAHWLGQGTIYPDVIESVNVKGPSATIKSHHNVGGLPENMKLKVLEPLNTLFKDEVRLVGNTMGIDTKILNRHPFPGPGLAIRILGDITADKVEILQQADDIFISGLKSAHLYDNTWQAGAILLPVKSVGVMGDERTYENVVCLRAVESLDGMTADWCYLPNEFLSKISNEIINKVKGINRVVYDISSKPPATIEWE